MSSFIPAEKHDLYFQKTVTRWDEAIPLGSGLTGCLIWGNGAPLRLSLDRGDLWDTRPAPEVLAEDYTYEELIRLVQQKKQDEIRRRFDDFYNYPTPTKIPAGRLELSFGKAADNVDSHLSLQRAEASVNLHFGDQSAQVCSFIHANQKYGFLRVTGPLPKIRMVSHDFTPNGSDDEMADSVNTGSTRLLGYPPAQDLTIGQVNIVLQHTAENFSFALMSASTERNGILEAVYYVAASTDGEHWLENAAAMVESALAEGYDSAISTHLDWWQGFWGKSRISIPDEVIEKNWYVTNYLLGSCSRKGCPPMPLQGVWTADEGKLPPWKGDYHGDLNTQFSYYNFLKSDHLEEGESFLDFMWNLNDKANAFAKSFFDADGLCLPSVFAFDGTSLGGWPMYSTNITNQIWQDHIFYLYYKYTGDESFLKDRLYPYLKGTEAVVRRHLIRDAAGKYTLPLTSSPEIHNNELDAWLDSLSNYDLALLRFLYEALMEFAPAVCPEDLPIWEDIYQDLPEFAVDESGFMLTANEALQYSHRHLSHLMSVFPLDQCQYDRSEEERQRIDDSIRTLERLGRGEWVGFSFAWMAEIYAKTHNGEGAAYQLRSFFEHLCSQNGFHLNGDFRCTGITYSHYRPFTLESNMCAADAIQEMLMQCYDGTISVFPAIPETWRETSCEFQDFLSFGGVKVSSAIKNGVVSYIRLNPRKNTDCRIRNPFGNQQIQLQAGNSVSVMSGDIITIPLEAGIEYILKPC